MRYFDYIDKQLCPICHRHSNVMENRGLHWLFVECDVCGTYNIARSLIDDNFECAGGKYDVDMLASYLFYNNDKIKAEVLVNGQETPGGYYGITPKLVDNWYPKTFSEKVDLILLKLAELSTFDGDSVDVSNCVKELMFCRKMKSFAIQPSGETNPQIAFLEDYIIQQNYIKKQSSRSIRLYQLLPGGIDKVYNLQKTQSTNKNVFVSMAFNDDTKATREAIRTGVMDAGFSPEYIDEIIHNHQIMPEMFRLIRESRFLILEISDPNYGAYYEAGYALGLGKEVIICCSESVFKKEYLTEEEKKYAKYLKPHFDIAQKQILVWKNHEDLIKKLCEWIKALF